MSSSPGKLAFAVSPQPGAAPAPTVLALARRWLLNTPVLGETGEAFSTVGVAVRERVPSAR